MKTPNEKWMLGQSLDNQVWHGTAWQAWAWAWTWACNVRPLHGESCDVQRAASPCDANEPCGVWRATPSSGCEPIGPAIAAAHAFPH